MEEKEGVTIIYSSRFLRSLKKASPELRKKIDERMVLFKQYPSHATLHVHRLTGSLSGYSAFSVTHNFRVIFKYVDPHSVWIETSGNHDLYDRM